MANGEWEFDVDISDVLDELDRLAELPSLTGQLRLEAVLAEQFQATQQAVHVITGSLRASGRVSSYMRDHVWHGEIEYGGNLVRAAVPGPPRKRVNYAEYEQRRGLSGGRNHDFMAPAALIGEIAMGQAGYVAAMLANLRGDGGDL